MTYLNENASLDYLLLSNQSFDLKLIGDSHYRARLSALRSMTTPSDHCGAIAAQILNATEESNLFGDWSGEFDLTSITESLAASAQSTTKRLPPKYMHFMVNSGPLRNWVFHLTDDDWHPSVPHGHYRGKSHPKLDSYLGYTYRGVEQIGRVKREVIVDLWNRDSFRRFATRAIDYYLNRHPHYQGWRVQDPRRLPRKRKGK